MAEINLHQSIFRFTAEDFATQVNQAIQLKEQVLNIDINSPGGSIDSGNTIVTAIEKFKASGGTVNIVYSGLGASYVVFLAPFANGRIEASPLARFMAHRAAFRDTDDVSEDEKNTAIDFNKKMRSALKSRKVPEQILARIFDAGEDIWFTAEQARKNNLVDEVKNFDISLDSIDTISQLAANGSINELFDYYQTHKNNNIMAEEKKTTTEPKKETTQPPVTPEPKAEFKDSPEFKTLSDQNKILTDRLAATELREKKELIGRRVISEDLLGKMSIDEVNAYCAQVAEPEEKKETEKAPDTESTLAKLNDLISGKPGDGGKPEAKTPEIGSKEFQELDDAKQDEILNAYCDNSESELNTVIETTVKEK